MVVVTTVGLVVMEVVVTITGCGYGRRGCGYRNSDSSWGPGY